MPGEHGELPDLVPISLHRVFRLRDKIVDRLEDSFLGLVLRGKMLWELVGELQQVLPPDIHGEVLFASVRHLGGTKLTEGALRLEAWRLAGNVHRLVDQKPCPPWTSQLFDEWVPVQVVSCRIKRTLRKKKVGGEFTARILGGTPATMLTEFFWTHGFCGNFAQHVGFTPPWKQLPFKKCEEFVGLRFYGLLEAPREGAEISRRPRFQHVKVTSSLLNYNRKLLRKRARLDGFKCPLNYQHPCFRCPIGYRDCHLAVHPETYTKHLCIACNKESWFESHMVALGICVACQQRRDLGHT